MDRSHVPHEKFERNLCPETGIVSPDNTSTKQNIRYACLCVPLVFMMRRRDQVTLSRSTIFAEHRSMLLLGLIGLSVVIRGHPAGSTPKPNNSYTGDLDASSDRT